MKAPISRPAAETMQQFHIRRAVKHLRFARRHMQLSRLQLQSALFHGLEGIDGAEVDRAEGIIGQIVGRLNVN